MVESDELAGDHRLTVLRHVSGHIRRIAVTRYNRLIITGESCHGSCHEFFAPVTPCPSGRRASLLKFPATALA